MITASEVDRIATATANKIANRNLRENDPLTVEQAWRDANVTRAMVATLVADVATWPDTVLNGLKAALTDALNEMELGDLSAHEVAETVVQKMAERLSA